MAKTSQKWTLFYVRNSWERHRAEIGVQQFDSELDMLVYAWKNPLAIKRSVNLNHVLSPDGELGKVPNDLHERMDVLRKELIEKEQRQAEEEKARAHGKKVATAKKEYRQRKAREQEEASCPNG